MFPQINIFIQIKTFTQIKNSHSHEETISKCEEGHLHMTLDPITATVPHVQIPVIASRTSAPMIQWTTNIVSPSLCLQKLGILSGL